MGENEVDQLYKDAIYWHLISEGFTEYRAEIEARRRSGQKDIVTK
jgi:hypothetical protein